LGIVPAERLLNAKAIQDQRFAKQKKNAALASAVPGITWAERGPNNIGGRTRAIAFDLNDAPNYKKVWAGGVGGGLWMTTDITAASPVWTKQNDLFSNLAITSFAQSSSNKQDMYFGTGEGWFNADAIRGLGIWYSADGGTTWNQLASTNNSSFQFIQKIVVDNSGNVYACTKTGLQKSTNKGTSWTQVLGTSSANILPGSTSTANNAAADIEIAANGDLYCSFGIFSAGSIFRSTNNGTSWSNIMPAITARRIELACAPSNANIVYALFHSNSTNDCSAIQKFDASTSTWTAGTVPTIIDQGSNSNFTRGQAWYDLIAAVDPNNANSLYIGGVDALRSDDAGATWTQMSTWSLYNATGFTAAQNIHADHHNIVYQPGSSAIALWSTDGGVFRTTNANIASSSKPTWTSKNSGYDVTQYYSVDIHPSTTDYLIGGAQDNGTHVVSAAGIGAGSAISGGDGGFAHIDQQNGNIQISSFTNNNFNVTTDGWATGNSYFFVGGSFIAPTDYDNTGKYLYGDSTIGTFFRWTSPSSNGPMQAFSPSGFPASRITHVAVSPITLNRVYFGFSNGAVVRVDNANTASPVVTSLKAAGSPSANVSCVVIDPSNENHIVITYSNYGSVSILESTNALSGSPTWTNDFGNLPDMPVRWAVFDPRNSDWLILATEMGVWSTDNLNAASTDWQPTNSGFANTRVDMLKYRSSDRLLAAATHGRGFFTTNIPAALTSGIKFEKATQAQTESTTSTTGCRSYTDYTVNMLIENAPAGDAIVTLDVQAGNTATVGSDFDFTTNGSFSSPSSVLTFANGSTSPMPVTIRVYNDAEVESTESFILEYNISGTTNATRAVGPQTFSLEILDNDQAPALPSSGSASLMSQALYLGGTASSTPFNAKLSGQRTQMLYKASELTAAGVVAGPITSYGIYLEKHSTRPYQNLNISMGTTSVSYLVNGGVTVVPVSTVKTLASYATVNGLNNFTLDNAFVWDGTSNLVVEICYNNGTTSGSDLSDISLGSADGGTATQGNLFYQDNLTCGSSFGSVNYFSNGEKPAIQLGFGLPGNPIESTLNNNTSTYLSETGTYYFYTGSNTIINSIGSASANLGCVSSNIYAAGNTWQAFSGGFRSQKVIDINPSSNSGASSTIGLYFTAAELGGKSPATLKIAKTTAATLAAANSSNTVLVTTSYASFGTGYVFTGNFTGFSKFFLVDNTVVLPLSLVSFDGQLQNAAIQLNWRTASEQNSKQFELQKSIDGVNYFTIATLDAAGNSNSPLQYNYSDKQLSAFNYYRLKMIDKDGRFTLSKVVLIDIPGIKQHIWVLNNPFINTVELRLAKLPAQPVQTELTAMNGSRVYAASLPASSSLKLDFSGKHLSAGTYILRTRIDGVWYVNKLLKQ
jgi:hypothetical protein